MSRKDRRAREHESARAQSTAPNAVATVLQPSAALAAKPAVAIAAKPPAAAGRMLGHFVRHNYVDGELRD